MTAFNMKEDWSQSVRKKMLILFSLSKIHWPFNKLLALTPMRKILRYISHICFCINPQTSSVIILKQDSVLYFVTCT